MNRKLHTFLYDEHNKLRIVWRVILFWMLALIPIIAWQILFRTAASILGTTPRSILPEQSFRASIIGGMLLCFATLFASYFAIKKIEKSDWRDFLGWHFKWPEMNLFIRYFGLAGLVMLIIFSMIVLSGIATVSIHSPDFSIFVPILLIAGFDFLIASIGEETLDRGYIFQVLSKKSPLFAILFTSAIFSIGHLSERWSTTFSLLNIFIVGSLIGFIYLKTQNLWAIWGFHFGMNFFEALVFQFPVEGYENLSAHIFSYHFTVSRFISGGPAGVTGSVIYTLVILMLFGFLFKRFKNMKSSRTDAVE